MKFIILLSLFAANLMAGDIDDRYIFINPGISIPVYGHFGDSEIGFKKAYGFSLGYIKDVDDLVSYGFFTSNYQYYENRKVDMKLRIFSFTPVLFSWLGLSERKYYFYFGGGIYHISQPSNPFFDSSSSTEGGFKIGSGIKKKLYKNIYYGCNLEFNHIFNIKGKNFDLGSGNTISLSISVIFPFYLK